MNYKQFVCWSCNCSLCTDKQPGSIYFSPNLMQLAFQYIYVLLLFCTCSFVSNAQLHNKVLAGPYNTTFWRQGYPLSTGGTFGHLQEFSPESETIGAYLDRVQHYFDAHKVDNELRVHAFLSVTGSKTYSLLRNQVSPDKPGDRVNDQ